VRRQAVLLVTYESHDKSGWPVDWSYHLRMGDLDADTAVVVLDVAVDEEEKP